jgi:hypothetical protein
MYLLVCFFFIFSYRKIFVNPIADICKKLDCKMFLEEQKPGLTDNVRKIALDLEIRTPEILITNKIENAAFCIGKDKDESAVVISESVLSNFSLDELSSILAHELNHAKMFLRHRMHQVLTQALFFKKVFLASVLMIVPFELFFSFIDLGIFEFTFWLYTSGRVWIEREFLYWLWLHHKYYIEPVLVMVLLLIIFLSITFYTSYKNKTIAPFYSEDTSEFLADAYSSFYFNDAKMLKRTLEKFGRYEAQRIFSTLEERYSPLFFAKERKAYRASRWQDVLHEKFSLRDKAEYSPALRLSALSFLDRILTNRIEVRINKRVDFKLGSFRLYRGFVLYMLWTYIFAVNNVKRKNVKNVLHYISEHHGDFDINDCAKLLAIPRFHVFLIFCMLMANNVIEVEE